MNTAIVKNILILPIMTQSFIPQVMIDKSIPQLMIDKTIPQLMIDKSIPQLMIDKSIPQLMIDKTNIYDQKVNDVSTKRSEPDNFDSGLKYIFKTPTKSKIANPLQPTQTQVNKLETRKNIHLFLHSLTPSEWSQTMLKYKNLFFHKTAQNKISDQEDRADIIVKEIKSNKLIQTIILMDGHGRFVLTLLNKLGDLADKIKILVVEIDPIVHRWHQLLFPKSVESVLGNIYDFRPTQNNYIYINFCGIGGANGQKYLADYLNSLKPNNEFDQKLLISLSIARTANYDKKNQIKPDERRTDKWLLFESYPANTWLAKYNKTYIGKRILDGPKNQFPTFELVISKTI
jgi:hypothetical protein